MKIEEISIPTHREFAFTLNLDELKVLHKVLGQTSPGDAEEVGYDVLVAEQMYSAVYDILPYW